LETVYSLSGEMPAETGPAVGDETSLRAGALIRGNVRKVCWVRKISAGGAILYCEDPVESGERLELELMSGEQLTGTIVWRRGTDLGLSFDERIDLFSVIAQDIVNQPGERRRMPRVELVCQVLLETRAGTELVTSRDLAQGGVKLDVPRRLAPEEKVVVTMEGLHPVDGVVRWSSESVAGIAFLPELKWQELMVWLKARRGQGFGEEGSPFAPGPPVPAPMEAPEEGSVQLNLPARVREGTKRWTIEVAWITTRGVAFDSFAALRIGASLWIALPGLEGWPARIVSVDGYRYSCEFTQPLHPAVLERILALANPGS
jgi:hypothetical protein